MIENLLSTNHGDGIHLPQKVTNMSWSVYWKSMRIVCIPWAADASRAFWSEDAKFFRSSVFRDHRFGSCNWPCVWLNLSWTGNMPCTIAPRICMYWTFGASNQPDLFVYLQLKFNCLLIQLEKNGFCSCKTSGFWLRLFFFCLNMVPLQLALLVKLC
jgi:hypothetical protein